MQQGSSFSLASFSKVDELYIKSSPSCVPVTTLARTLLRFMGAREDLPSAPRVDVEGHFLVGSEASLDSTDLIASDAQVPARYGRTVPAPYPEKSPTGRPPYAGDSEADVRQIKHRLCRHICDQKNSR